MGESRVCIFPGTLGGGGATRNMLRLADGLSGHGYAVDLFVTARESGIPHDIPASIRLIRGGRTVKGCLIPLVRYLRRERPAAIIGARTYVNLVAAWAVMLAGCNTRVLATERTVAGAEQRRDPKPLQGLVNRLRDATYPHVDHVIAVSGSVADDLRGLNRSWLPRVRVIYNPIVSPALQRLAVREVTGIGPLHAASPLLVSVGRLTPAKDQATLLRAFATVRRDHPDAGLVLAGEGPLRGALEALAIELGITEALHMPGYLENPYPLMKRADVFVQSSQWEGLPTVLVEALALDTPVVATNCAGGVAEVLEDGRAGTLVDVGDADGLARGIVRELAMDRDDARTRSAQRFAADRMVRCYLELIEPAMGQAGTGSP